MAPALSNLVILTPLLRGSQNTPRGAGEERKKCEETCERRIARFVRARHSNENLPMRFHVKLDVNAIDGDRTLMMLNENGINGIFASI